MSFFEGIGFENFRVFSNQTNFGMAPITILTGTNNSGKSTLINGIKLLKDNFKDVREVNNIENDLDIENIMNRVIESGTLLEKYGNLGQFINRDSKKEEFTISFRRSLYGVDNEVDILITICLNKNNIKNGRIVKIVVQSAKNGSVIFQIYERKKSEKSTNYEHLIKIDLTYFKKLLDTMIEKSKLYYEALDKLEEDCKMDIEVENFEDSINTKIKVFNLKFSSSLIWNFLTEDNYSEDFPYIPSANDIRIEPMNIQDNPDYLIAKKILQLIQEQKLSIPGFYDFSFIWKNDELNKIKFEEEILSFYELPFDEAYIKFNDDILNFLSNVEWTTKNNSNLYKRGLNTIIKDSKYSKGVGFKRFLQWFTTLNNIRHFSAIISNERNINYEIFNSQIESAININPDFYYRCFKPFLDFADKIEYSSLPGGYSSFIIKPFRHCIETEQELLTTNIINETFKLVQTTINSLSGFEFLSSFRIVTKRVYSFSDEDQFPVLIKSIEALGEEKRRNAYSFINRWLKTFGIADKLEIEHDKDTSNFKPYFIKNDDRLLMADLGFGTSQILPLLLKLVPTNIESDNLKDPKNKRHGSVIIIEEPEANLHPALQSKLADLFVEAIRYGSQIVIETHSEYLIRKLQNLTAKEIINPTDTQIYYFNNPGNIPEGEEQVKKINIKKDGSLTDNFGAGFFDEADNIAIELFLINQSQKN